MGRVTISRSGGRLYLRFRFSHEAVALVRGLEGRTWHAAGKVWSVPDAPGMLERVRELFEDEPTEGGLMASARRAARARGLSRNTRDAYMGWTRRFLDFVGGGEVNEARASAFLVRLAESGVSASTQNQAVGALAFLFRHALGRDLRAAPGIASARRRRGLPTVLGRDEVRRILTCMRGTPRLMAQLMYGAGLRLSECCGLRVRDVDFRETRIVLRGPRDRYTVLPSTLRDALQGRIERLRAVHAEDRRRGFGAEDPSWEWLFPAARPYEDAAGGRRRHHVHESAVQKAFAEARRLAGVDKPAGCQTLRNSFAAHLLEDGCDIRTVQELLGHRSVKTTMRFLKVMALGPSGVVSPVDRGALGLQGGEGDAYADLPRHM